MLLSNHFFSFELARNKYEHITRNAEVPRRYKASNSIFSFDKV